MRRVIEATAVADGPFVRIRVTGESFLHQMVRSIVGTALEVGDRTQVRCPWMRDALAARDRSAAGPVAAAHGLTLVDVGYKDAELAAPPAQLQWPWSDRVVSHAERRYA